MIELLSIVVNYKTDKLLHEFIDSYMEYVDAPDRRLVVADVQNDGIPVNVAKYKTGYNAWSENIGYARAVNYTANEYKDEDRYPHFALGIFNADTRFIDRNCVDSCVAMLQQSSNIGIVGPLQVNDNGRVKTAGILGTNKNPLDRGWNSKYPERYEDVQDAVYLSGSALFVRRSMWDYLSEDKDFLEVCPNAQGAMLETPLYYEDTWLSYFARHKGYRSVYNGHAKMIHHHDSSPNSPLKGKVKESRAMFRSACNRLGIEN